MQAPQIYGRSRLTAVTNKMSNKAKLSDAPPINGSHNSFPAAQVSSAAALSGLVNGRKNVTVNKSTDGVKDEMRISYT